MEKYEYISTGKTKLYASLSQKKVRNETGLFMAEGIKICEELVKSDYSCKDLIVSHYLLSELKVQNLITQFKKKGTNIFLASRRTIEKISDTVTPQGIIAIVAQKETTINTASKSFIAFENAQDPGNLGTIIRTAVWFGINNIILSENSGDLYNPKGIRASMGNIFHINFVYTDNLFDFCKDYYPNHKFFAASLNTDKYLTDIQIPEKFGIFFGNESKGLSEEVLSKIQNKFIIRGAGIAESLNVASSAAISLFYFTNKNL